MCLSGDLHVIKNCKKLPFTNQSVTLTQLQLLEEVTPQWRKSQISNGSKFGIWRYSCSRGSTGHKYGDLLIKLFRGKRKTWQAIVHKAFSSHIDFIALLFVLLVVPFFFLLSVLGMSFTCFSQSVLSQFLFMLLLSPLGEEKSCWRSMYYFSSTYMCVYIYVYIFYFWLDTGEVWAAIWKVRGVQATTEVKG